MIFVFGSNLAGIHGAGAAKHAHLNEGAVMMIGTGHHGNSYAIPTKGYHIECMPLEFVAAHVEIFLNYARGCEFDDSIQFKVTQIGCGLAGFVAEEIAPLFKDAPGNCYFDRAWAAYLPAGFKFWN